MKLNMHSLPHRSLCAASGSEYTGPELVREYFGSEEPETRAYIRTCEHMTKWYNKGIFFVFREERSTALLANGLQCR